jgi:hypothetical protein
VTEALDVNGARPNGDPEKIGVDEKIRVECREARSGVPNRSISYSSSGGLGQRRPRGRDVPDVARHLPRT